MGEFSVLWALGLIAITIAVYKVIVPFISGKRNKMLWLVAIIAVCIYSGIGISYSVISKSYIVEYFIYIVVMGISLAIFTKYRIVRSNGHLCIWKREEIIRMTNSEKIFWDSTLVSEILGNDSLFYTKMWLAYISSK